MAKYYAWGAVAAVVLLIVAMVIVTMGRLGPDDKYAACRATTVAGGVSQIGGPFTLIDENGKTVTNEDVLDQPSLIYFGYTFCPDVCPLDNSRNAEAIEILETEGKMVQPVFISIDPQRDTPEVLRDFTDNLHPRMLGLTGSDEQIRAVNKAYRNYFARREAEDGDPEYYLMDHMTNSYLVFPGEGTVALFDRTLRPDQMAESIGCFLDAR